MQTLGLSGPPSERDNFFKRLFWPGNHPSEVDDLGQQGFWLCLILAVGLLILMSFQGHWLFGLVIALFFALGGIGVREHSVTAALLVASAYLFNIIADAIGGQFPGFLTLIAAGLLLANIRGTWIASQWKQKGDPEVFPYRLNENWRDKLVDQMPPKVWPKAKAFFYVLSVVYLSLTIFGAGVFIARGGRSNPPQAPIEEKSITVQPPS
jgi:hypothetical protein